MSVLRTEAEILAISPDAASIKAARGLLAPAKWLDSGHNEHAVWGQCKGSGKNPYQTRIDLSANPPAFKCSCPSRKFPCKHALALLLLRADSKVPVENNIPEWVQQWLQERQTKVQKKEEKQQKQKELVNDPAAQEKLRKQQAKTQQRRWQRIETGMQELQLWLQDLLEQGLAQVSSNNDAQRFWMKMNARMVDAQMPGMAARVLQGWETIDSGAGWQARLLAQLGHWQLMIDAVLHRDQLHDATRADVMAALGWALDKTEVQTLAQSSGNSIEDNWLVLGCYHHELSKKLSERYVWLRSQRDGHIALLLDFSYDKTGFEQAWLTGRSYHLTLAFYPGHVRLRAVTIGAVQAAAQPVLLTMSDFGDTAQTALLASLSALSNAIAANPLQSVLPLWCAYARFYFQDGQGWQVVWEDQRRTAVMMDDEAGWELLALSGGQPLFLFGQWDGQQWRLLSAWQAAGHANNNNHLHCLWYNDEK